MIYVSLGMRLESRLRKLVCSGALDVKIAQQEIARDWIGAVSAKCLPHLSSEKTDYRFMLAVADEGSFQNLEVSVKFKSGVGRSGSFSRNGVQVERCE